MPFLLLLILTLICLQGKWPEPRWRDPAAVVLVTWTGVAAFVAAAGLLAWRLGRRLGTDPGSRQTLLRRFGKLRRQHAHAFIAFYLLALYLAGWGWTVKETVNP